MSDTQKIWKEIAQLREELAALKIKKELVLTHAQELQQLSDALQNSADVAATLVDNANKIAMGLDD